MKYIKDPNGNIFKLEDVHGVKINNDTDVVVYGHAGRTLSYFEAPAPELAVLVRNDFITAVERGRYAVQPSFDYLFEDRPQG
jgi:hypothetical protein